MDPKTRTGTGMLIALKTHSNNYVPKAALASSPIPGSRYLACKQDEGLKVTGKKCQNNNKKLSMNPGEVIEGEGGLRKNIEL